MTGRVEGKVAVVTGAASGIGRAAAERYAAEGAAVVCADVADAGAVAARIAAAGGAATAVTADVTDVAATERMAAVALEAYGAIDVLYANAGVPGVGTAASCTPETWERVLAVNLTGVWLSMRAVLPHMVARKGGAIINQASIGGVVGVPGIAPYAAAKAGVIGLTRQAAVDFAPHRVRVNAIAPGTAPTPLVTDTYRRRLGPRATAEDAAEALEEAAARYPLGRLGTAEEIAALALYLGSDEAAWVTGGVHVIDGGLTAA